MVPTELSVFFESVFGNEGLECGGADEVVVDPIFFAWAGAAGCVRDAEAEEGGV